MAPKNQFGYLAWSTTTRTPETIVVGPFFFSYLALGSHNLTATKTFNKV